MKTLARISGLTAAISVCCLGTRGPALLGVILTGGLAMCALFVSCGRLGYFEVATKRSSSQSGMDTRRQYPSEQARVIYLAEKGRANRTREAAPCDERVLRAR